MLGTHRSRIALGLLLVLVGLGRTGATAGATTCDQPSAGHVAVVVDFGTLPDAPPGVQAVCVTLPERATGIDALRAAAPGQVAVDSSGKVCGILGYPANPAASNCSAPHDGRVRYWAYFLGTERGWEYSAAGAAAVRVHPDVVQGWRYLDVPASGGSGGIVPPRDLLDGRQTARWASTCPAVPSPTMPPTAPPATDGTPGTAPAIGESPPQSGHPPAISGRAPATTGPSAGSTTTAPPRGSTSLASGAITGMHSTGRARLLTPAEVRSATRAAPDQGSRLGAILGIGIGVALIAALLTLAAWRSRRRLAQD